MSFNFVIRSVGMHCQCQCHSEEYLPTSQKQIHLMEENELLSEMLDEICQTLMEQFDEREVYDIYASASPKLRKMLGIDDDQFD